MDREIELFNNYYARFDNSHKSIKSKYDHTFRVVEYAKKIAHSLNLSDEDINLAKICALFHDIGRFNEVKLFNDLDNNPFDHGDEGEKVLRELNYDNDIVLKSTKYHNKYSVPDNLDERTKMFCNITRDADKLDILYTQCLNIDKEESIEKDILDSIYSKKLVNNSKVSNSSESMIRGLSFIFDLNFNESFKIIDKDKIIDQKLNILINNNYDKELDKLKIFIDNYLKERLKEC